MIETKEKQIDGHTYAVTQFPGRRAFKIKTAILLKLGPALAVSLDGAVAKAGADLNIASIASALEKITMSSDEFLDLVLELISQTRRDGKEITPEVFDLEFAGNLQTVYKVAAFVLEANFGNFFGSGGIGKLTERFRSPTPSANA